METWLQLLDLLLAFALASAIGLEREYRQKSAGLRTHALVGVGTALFVLVSKYGFADVMIDGITRYDPSRIAAQIVSGIGFIGGGLIFVRRDAVRGLTTAATIWVTCAVGMACGAHLYIIAVAVTAAHFVIAFVYTPLARRLPFGTSVSSELQLWYRPGEMVLARVLGTCTGQGYTVVDVSVDKSGHPPWGEPFDGRGRDAEGRPVAVVEGSLVAVTVSILGRASFAPLVAALADVPGLVRVESRAESDGD